MKRTLTLAAVLLLCLQMCCEKDGETRSDIADTAPAPFEYFYAPEPPDAVDSLRIIQDEVFNRMRTVEAILFSNPRPQKKGVHPVRASDPVHSQDNPPE